MGLEQNMFCGFSILVLGRALGEIVIRGVCLCSVLGKGERDHTQDL